MQARRAGFQGAQHDAVAGQNQAAQKLARGINGLNGDSGAHHHHHHRACRPLRQAAVPGPDHGHPAVGAQPRGVVVAVGQAGFCRGGDHPLGGHIPNVHLFLHTALDWVTGHDAAQHAVWRRQVGPGAVGQLVYVFKKFRALGQQRRVAVGGLVKRPLEARVANVDCQKIHGRIINKPGWAPCRVCTRGFGAPWAGFSALAPG